MKKNPYDFVRTNWKLTPDRTKNILWHDKFQGLSGTIDCQINIKSPVFIPVAKNNKSNEFCHRKEKKDGKSYLIPGSSIKGMLRSLVETLGNGCYSKFDGDYKNKSRHKKFFLDSKLPVAFKACRDNNCLCIGCRLFGMMGNKIFKGNVAISDAELITPVNDRIFERFRLGAMGGPSPWHKSFYLDKAERNILGRKFYYHHPNAKNSSCRGATEKTTIKKGSFRFKVYFQNIDKKDFPALLYSLVLEDAMWHKIGYGKPMGLGSIKITCKNIIIRDLEKRYLLTNEASRCYKDDELKGFIEDTCSAFLKSHPSPEVLDDLRRVWSNDVSVNEQYDYPEYDWFEKNPGISLEEYQEGKR